MLRMRNNLRRWPARLTKRIFDTLSALFLLALLSPLMLLIGLLIRQDGGPALFAHPRIGKRGRVFNCYKFRTMVVDAEQQLEQLLQQSPDLRAQWENERKLRHDPRVSRLGAFLRKSSLDELPQFLNVLKGDMSIVGPRPPLPREVALYSVEDRRRLLAMPGITCLWQVGERNGGTFEIGDRNSIDFDEQVQLDVRYIESQSALRDLWIMLKTLPAMLLGK